MSGTIDSELKLFYHLTEKILSKEIVIFSVLAKYTNKLSLSFNPDKVLLKTFKLLKELHWGFFKEMDKAKYTKLWKELVVPNPSNNSVGDLKRNISIANIYISMMDIHGYTKFCQESKSNLSRLRKLDEFLHDGVKKIAGKNQALANRERGDEIVIIAASATDIIKTTLEIINSFSKSSVIKNNAVARNRDDYSIVLPDFKVTAGIAGGNLMVPLIITESGLLAGFLLNTAARLQTLANEYSPSESKIMVTNSVYANFIKENKVVKSDIYTRKLIQFFDNGQINFKGTKIPSYEIIFREKEKYRLKYEENMKSLYESLKQDLWKHKVFQDLIAVIIQVCKLMPSFSVEITSKANVQVLSNVSLTRLCDLASQMYEKENYTEAQAILGSISGHMEYIPDFDRLVLNYTMEIYAKYNIVLDIYERKLDSEIDKKIDLIFNPQYKTAYYNAKKNLGTYEKLKKYAFKSSTISNKKNMWYTLIQENLKAMKLEIYAGKR